MPEYKPSENKPNKISWLLRTTWLGCSVKFSNSLAYKDSCFWKYIIQINKTYSCTSVYKYTIVDNALVCYILLPFLRDDNLSRQQKEY